MCEYFFRACCERTALVSPQFTLRAQLTPRAMLPTAKQARGRDERSHILQHNGDGIMNGNVGTWLCTFRGRCHYKDGSKHDRTLPLSLSLTVCLSPSPLHSLSLSLSLARSLALSYVSVSVCLSLSPARARVHTQNI